MLYCFLFYKNDLTKSQNMKTKINFILLVLFCLMSKLVLSQDKGFDTFKKEQDKQF